MHFYHCDTIDRIYFYIFYDVSLNDFEHLNGNIKIKDFYFATTIQIKSKILFELNVQLEHCMTREIFFIKNYSL
jgi:hypothetical protein